MTRISLYVSNPSYAWPKNDLLVETLFLFKEGTNSEICFSIELMALYLHIEKIWESFLDTIGQGKVIFYAAAKAACIRERHSILLRCCVSILIFEGLMKR